jgi:AcrR family transcriptional regulator
MQILLAALELLDREGLDRFSMRRLADELGVGTMTVYGYFRGKNEILDALVDAAASQQVLEISEEGPWRTRLRELIMTIRQGLVEHPAIVELRYRRPLLSPGALQLTELGVRILLDAGFSKRDAARFYRVLFVYTFGFSAFGPDAASEAERELAFAALSALPAGRYPALVEAAREAAETMADETLFELGLDALLEQLARQLEREG